MIHLDELSLNRHSRPRTGYIPTCDTNRRCGLLLAVVLPVFIAGPSAASVVISSQSTQNMNCSAGVCAPTAADAILNVGDLESLLASGSIRVTTTGSGGVQADNIDIDAALTWSTTSTLALDAYQSIAVSQPVAVAGSGGLTITTNDGGSGGIFSFGPKSNITFLNLTSRLTINSRKYELVDSLPALVSAVAGKPQGAYALANSYDASQDGTYHGSPIHKALTGTIEGLGNTISHLSIIHRSHTDTAMVRLVKRTGAIEHLRLTSVDVRGFGNYVALGTLVAENSGYLFGDFVTGRITGRGTGLAVGGLAGNNLGTGMVVSSSAHVEVKTSGGIGGGLLGQNVGMVELSSAEGTVSGALVGGFVGQNMGPVSQSFATGAANGGEAGGFVGDNNEALDAGTIENSYSTGAVTGGQSGGFVSQDDFNGPTVSYSYSTGAVPSQAGGFVCNDYPDDFFVDYWDTTTSGTLYAACSDSTFRQVTGLTTKQLRSGLPEEFSPSIWAEDRKINNGFPYLINNPPEK